jgi:hypothetical protein
LIDGKVDMYTLQTKPNPPATSGSALQRALPNLAPVAREQTGRDAPLPGRGFDFSGVASFAPTIQRKATIGSPGDPLEREADAVADRVIGPASTGATVPALQRKCAACEEEDKRQIHPKRTTAAGPAMDSGAATQATARGGVPLSNAMRSYFEPRFGHDFSQVRVHTDGEAANAARAIQAHAYTLGRDIVFASGAYAPGTIAGRRLLAHELTHVVQQGGRAEGVQRKLNVDAKASDDPKTAVSTIVPLVTALCPDFEIVRDGLVWPKSGTDSRSYNFKKVATGKQQVGCCCLSTLAAAPDDWRIIVTSKDAPATDLEKREVRMTPTSGAGAPDFRYWTGGPTEAMKQLTSAEAFGHELCGHGALRQIKAHPSSAVTGDRPFSDVHDPTVRIQNLLAKEMGAPGDRGLAGGGLHRGESLRVFSIGPYAADADDPTPFAAQIKGAVDFLDGNDYLLVDTVGFRNAKDVKASVSLDRASNVQAEVQKGVVKSTVEKQMTAAPAPQETLNRVQPATDGGVSASPVVELRMASFPAGLIKPIGSAPPPTPVHVKPEFENVVQVLKGEKGTGPNACHDLLADQAWP